MALQSQNSPSTISDDGSNVDFDVVVVGAGFGGLYALHHLRGLGLRCRLFEAGGGVGGTWYWNRYPGARVDIESLEYSYGFSEELQQEWDWTERYAGQAEVLRYLNHVADRFDLRRDIQFDTHITSAEFDETTDTWVVAAAGGESVRATYCVMAVGILSARNLPDIAGLDTFAGELYHSGSWPHDHVDLAGRRVGLIGTGASGVQMIPIIAQQADELFVFQRSPHWCVPLQNVPMPPDYLKSIKDNYPELRRRELDAFGGYTLVDFEIAAPNTQRALDVSDEERQKEYEYRWKSGGLSYYTSYTDLLFEEEANKTLRDFFEAKIRSIVKDQDVATALVPTDHPILTKRLCGENGYYEAFNRDDVTLVNVRESAIEECTSTGLRLADGTEYPLDVIICATGYDAATGPLVRMDIRGRQGRTLKDHWAAGARTHLGMMSNGFPNLFILDGPQSVAAFFQPVLLVEYQSHWVGRTIQHLAGIGASAIEPTAEAETAWTEHVNAVADQTLMPKANSWYMAANIPGKPRESLYYLGGFVEYRRRCDLAVDEGYDEFDLATTRELESQH
ncbi:flavin-containing monooxygenase [Pseudonocardia sp. T1-2H]|uniref:flavin-containing monooxygenase n=1 Tax=Pseudonocardia sp. T1-2H TaxID=3128899 RepID=UPI0031012DF8